MDDFTVNLSFPADQANTRTVTITGPMTIPHGREIKAALAEAMDAGETVQLDLRAVTEIDLIGLQAICATHRSSIANHKGFSIIRDDNPAFEAVVQALGFARHTGCIQDSGHTCVWAKGGEQ